MRHCLPSLMSQELKIFSGSAHPALADEIATQLGLTRSDATVTTFPDGETFVKINENIRGRDIYIVQPTCPPTNQNLMELLIMVDAARRASAERITAVIPFTGIPLPFISYGGTSLLFSLIGAGILLNISRDANMSRRLQPQSQPTESKRESGDMRRRNGRTHLSGSGRRV